MVFSFIPCPVRNRIAAAGATLVVGAIGFGALVALPNSAEARQQKVATILPIPVDDTRGMSVDFTFLQDGRCTQFFYSKMQDNSPSWMAAVQSAEGGIQVAFDHGSFTLQLTKSAYAGPDERPQSTDYWRWEADANGPHQLTIGPKQANRSSFRLA